jgi:hypothetical protein
MREGARGEDLADAQGRRDVPRLESARACRRQPFRTGGDEHLVAGRRHRLCQRDHGLDVPDHRVRDEQRSHGARLLA